MPHSSPGSSVPSLQPDFIPNLTRLGVVALLLAVCFVVAARFRHFWGTTPLSVLVGLFQVPQTVLAISLSVGIFPGVSVSPGSVVFFPATLFAILLVYVLEDEVEARRLVFGIIFANLTLAVLIFVGQPLFDTPAGPNTMGLNAAAAGRVAWVLVVGALLLAVDAFILIRAFEWFGERFSRHVMARSLFALVSSLAFDALAFSPIAFGRRPQFGALISIALMGKVAAGSFYSLVFMFLLPWSRMTGETAPAHKGRKSTGPVTYKDRFQDLQKAAVRDALTGVFNREYFDTELQTQADRALVRGDRLLLLLIDLDSFKRINDTYGHPAGDRVLTLFGEALRTVARQNDTVCRYGGEEFAILIAGGPPAIARDLFERTTEELARLWGRATPPLPFDAPSFSVGAATLPVDASSASGLLSAADQSLYASKRAGGNRLTFASEPKES
jgi:diguanylate cyclase (GGDEF)-like protein